MPSGYTSDIYKGNDLSLRGYLMRVGRGFGFAIEQRDDPNGESIHEVPETSYYTDKIALRRKRIAELNAMTAQEADWAAQEAHMEEDSAWLARTEKDKTLRARYLDMIEQVKEWQPSENIAKTDLKDTALKQLQQSLDFDCREPDRPPLSFEREPVALSGPDWLAKELEAAASDLAYAIKHEREDLERARERNMYIREFLESLPPADGDVA